MRHGNPISRRGFLRLGIAGALGASVLTLIHRHGPLPGRYEALLGTESPRALTRKEFAVLSLFTADVVAARAGHLSTGDARTAARIDLELTKHGGKLVGDIKAALAILEHGPLIRGQLARYSALADRDRIAYLSSLQHSPRTVLRGTYSGLRFFALFFYYTDPRCWARIGYAGPWVEPKLFAGGNRIANLEGRADAR